MKVGEQKSGLEDQLQHDGFVTERNKYSCNNGVLHNGSAALSQCSTNQMEVVFLQLTMQTAVCDRRA